MIDMPSEKILAAINRIAATSSKNEKQDLVKAYSAFPQFMRVLKAALDPTITYGVAKVPARKEGAAPGGNTFEDAPIWQLLDDLAARKLTGNAARDEIQKWMTFLTTDSAELLKRIILKDLKAGFGESTVNKVVPGSIPDFPYMRCCLPKDTKLENFDWVKGVLSQEKADGMFANVNHEIGGDVTISSRQGSLFPMEQFDELADDVKKTFQEGFQQHGELLVERNGVILPREIGNGILNSILSGGSFGPGERPVYMVWDQIPLDSVKPKGKYGVDYFSRFRALVLRIKDAKPGWIRVILTRVVHSLEEAYAHYAELLAQGKEGTIIKHPHATWRDGTSKEQVKLKLEFEVDLEIVGFNPGEGKNASTFGSIVTRTSDRLLEVSVSGFKDSERPMIWSQCDALIGTIMTVRANGVMRAKRENEPHSLFLPRYVEFRKDKTVADSFERVLALEEAAKKGAAIKEALKKAA